MKDMGCNPIEFTPPKEKEDDLPMGKISKHKRSMSEIRNEID